MLTLGRAIRVLDSGNHHPILCELESDGKPAGNWVVKAQDVESMSSMRPGAFEVVAELAGAEVCAWAGVPCPATGLFRFPTDPIDEHTASVPKKHRGEVKTVFQMNAGRLAFCSLYLEGAIDIDSDTLKGRLGKAITRTSGAALFAVDAYLRHDDRRRANPNAVWFDGQVVALDHGGAFAGFYNEHLRGEDIAQRTVLHATHCLHEHLFYDALVSLKEDVDWRAIGRRFADVPDWAIDVAAAGWPTELEPARGAIVSYLRARRAVVLELMDNVSKLFAGGHRHA